MTTNTTTPIERASTDETRQLPTGLQLTTLWLAMLLSMTFRDIHEIGTPEFLALAAEMDVPEWLFLVAGIVLTLPILLIPLNVIATGRWLRPANIAVAVVMALGFIGNPPGDLDDWWFFAVEIVLLAIIARKAWTSPAWTATTEPAA